MIVEFLFASLLTLWAVPLLQWCVSRLVNASVKTRVQTQLLPPVDFTAQKAGMLWRFATDNPVFDEHAADDLAITLAELADAGLVILELGQRGRQPALDLSRLDNPSPLELSPSARELLMWLRTHRDQSLYLRRAGAPFWYEMQAASARSKLSGEGWQRFSDAGSLPAWPTNRGEVAAKLFWLQAARQCHSFEADEVTEVKERWQGVWWWVPGELVASAMLMVVAALSVYPVVAGAQAGAAIMMYWVLRALLAEMLLHILKERRYAGRVVNFPVGPVMGISAVLVIPMAALALLVGPVTTVLVLCLAVVMSRLAIRGRGLSREASRAFKNLYAWRACLEQSAGPETSWRLALDLPVANRWVVFLKSARLLFQQNEADSPFRDMSHLGD